ncbi:hypothetical protein D3C78_1312540 [compost metagenome]
MAGAVGANMVDGLIDVIHQRHVQVQRQPFVVVIFRRDRHHRCRAVLQQRHGVLRRVQGDADRRHFATQCWQELCSDIAVHQQRLQRVTGAWALNFGVFYHRQCFVEITAVINIGVANADTAGDHRDG